MQRPLDDRTQLRVVLEAEAVLGVLALCEAERQTLVTSEVLVLENQRNPQAERKAFVKAILDEATTVITVTDRIRQRARTLENRGFKAFDALHVACAESAKADFFCTCDDPLLAKCSRQTDLTVKAVSPLELAREVSK